MDDILRDLLDGKITLDDAKKELELRLYGSHHHTLDTGREHRTGVPEVIIAEGKHEKHDKIYVSGRKNPLIFRADHPVLLLMMRIRDEAHRRAISYHRRLRKKNLTESQLDLIPGVGIKRKKILLRKFNNINNISKANYEELTEIPGISHSVAKNILSFFQIDNVKNRKVA